MLRQPGFCYNFFFLKLNVMECGIEMDVSAGKCLFTGVRYIQKW